MKQGTIFLLSPLINAALAVFIAMPLMAVVRGDALIFHIGYVPYALAVFAVGAVIPSVASYSADVWFSDSAWRIIASAAAGLIAGVIMPTILWSVGILHDPATGAFGLLAAVTGALCSLLSERTS
jgi:hypothetical protein